MKLFLLFVTFFLASCFELIERQNNIQNVKVIPAKQDESLNLIKNDLEEKFETNSNSKYILYVSLEKISEAGGLTSDAYSTNITLKMIVKYRLFDVSENKNIYFGSATKTTNYISESGKLVAERVGEKAALKNLSKQISEEIYEQIQNHFFQNEI